MFKRFIATATAGAVMFAAGVQGATAADARDYILATASTGGTYYPVGVAIATLAKVKLQPTAKIGMSAINSAGSGENVKLLRENQAQFAILQGLYGYYAWNGKGPVEADGPQKDMRAVSMLWQNVEHFVIQADLAKTGTINDMAGLKGKSVSLGKKNSGTIGSNEVLLANLGINIEQDYSLVYVGYGPSADAMQNGQIAGMSTPAGAPVGAVTKAFASMGDKIKLLSVTPEQLTKADGGLGLWTPYTIAAGTYPGVDADVTTIAQPNFLAVRADVPDEDVYLITKTMFENLGFLNAIHSATKAMALEKALAGLPMPLHPGARKYFEEAGLKIPETLVAQ
ncbi:MAG: TAXI family TRAP transporter solute-binding subunit [Alphaproteobacteria bacterium]|nr:TAXI family TRAP transporter solute-binding subunit [Alphaproteobacteria bacterium]